MKYSIIVAANEDVQSRDLNVFIAGNRALQTNISGERAVYEFEVPDKKEFVVDLNFDRLVCRGGDQGPFTKADLTVRPTVYSPVTTIVPEYWEPPEIPPFSTQEDTESDEES